MIATQAAAATFKFPPEVAAAARIQKEGPLMIDVRSIVRGDNPREEFDEADLQALAESMTSLSLLAPITVESAGPGSYRIVCGERRFRGARLAGWRKLPCYVVAGPPEMIVEMGIVENLVRKELGVLEESRALERLVRPIADGGAGLTREQAAARVGMHPDVVRRKLTLLKLPENWQKRVAKGEIASWDAVHLAVYSERPDVLGAVEIDLAQNPQNWPSGKGFLQQLRFVAEQFEALPQANGAKPPPIGTPNVPKLQRDCKTNNVFVEHKGERIVMGRYNTKQGKAKYAEFLASLPVEEMATTRPLARRSAPVTHDAALLIGSSDEDPVATIIELMKRLTSEAQIERVERSLSKRKAELVRSA